MLPDVASRLLAKERIALLGEVTKLSSDAPVERVAAETRLQEANAARNLVADNLIRLQTELDAIALPQGLLQESGAIEALYYSLGPFRSARETLARAKGQISLADTQVNSILAAISESNKDNNLRAIIPGATLRARVQSQITKGTKLQAEMDAVLQLVKTTKIELNGLNQEISGLEFFRMFQPLLSIS